MNGDREAFEVWWHDEYLPFNLRKEGDKERFKACWKAALASERAKHAEPVAPKFWKAKGLDPCENCGQLWRTHTGGMWKCPDAAPPAVQAEPVGGIIAQLRSLSAELDANDSPEQIHPGAAVCANAADLLEQFALQRDLDGPAWERHVERMRRAEAEVQRLKSAPPPDDEAVRLLRNARPDIDYALVNSSGKGRSARADLIAAIDAYLAKNAD